MGITIYILTYVMVGAALLLGGFLFFARLLPKIRENKEKLWLFKSTTEPGNPQICPICSSKLYKGDRLDTTAFPSVAGSNDRIMHIKGCRHCLTGRVERYCPVCGAPLGDGDILVARIFDRKRNRKAHVHIIGCSQCKKV